MRTVDLKVEVHPATFCFMVYWLWFATVPCRPELFLNYLMRCLSKAKFNQSVKNWSFEVYNLGSDELMYCFEICCTNEEVLVYFVAFPLYYYYYWKFVTFFLSFWHRFRAFYLRFFKKFFRPLSRVKHLLSVCSLLVMVIFSLIIIFFCG